MSDVLNSIETLIYVVKHSYYNSCIIFTPTSYLWNCLSHCSHISSKLNPLRKKLLICISLGVAKSRAWLSDFTFTFHFHALEKEMATHSSILAWRIPGTEEPSGLPSMGLHRIRHDWSNLAAAAAVCRKKIIMIKNCLNPSSKDLVGSGAQPFSI